MPDLSQYDPVFQAAGAEWNVNPTVLKAVAGQESGGKTGAVSPKGAVGLMQIMPDTAKYLGMTDTTDPTQSIWGAAKYLSEAQDKEKTADDALRYYHGGPDWRQKYGPESAAYAPAVGARFVQLAKAGNVASDAVPGTAGSAPPSQRAAPSGGSQGQGGAMTDEEFLKATAAPAAAPKGGMPDADFLAATGAKAAPPPTPTGPAIDPRSQLPNDPASMAQDMPLGSSADLRNLLAPDPNKRYGDVLPIASDPKTGLPVAASGPFGMAMPNMLRSTLQGGLDLIQGPGGMVVDPSGNLLTARLTPEATMALTTLPGDMPLRFGSEAPPFSLPGPAQTSEAYPAAALPQGAAPAFVPPGAPRPPAQLLEQPQPSLGTAGPAFVPPNVQTATPEGVPLPPQPASAPGVPGSVGAAASREGTPPGQIALAPEEAANARTVADLQWLTKTKQPGIADPNVYVDGINPTKAQIEQTVTASRELKDLKTANPAIAQEDAAVADLHNDIRKRAYADQAGSQLTTSRQLDQVGQKIEDDLANVWKNKGTADTGGIIQQIGTELSGSAGQLPPMKSAMSAVDKAIQTAGDDPQKLYAARRLVNYMQSKAGRLENPGYGDADVQRALVNVKGAIDQAIEPAAPGFQKAMSDYSAARGPLDAQSELQDRELGLLNDKGVMQYGKFHRLMQDVVLGRSPASPTNPFQGLSDTQMTALKAIHDDLQRVATARDLAAAQGSDTAQNMIGLIKMYAKMGGTVAAHGAANYVAPGLGSMAIQGFQNMLAPITRARTGRQQLKAGMEAIHPDMTNYLNQPPP